MEIINRIEDANIILPNLFDVYDVDDMIIIDIETTGLHRKYSKLILVGIVSFKNNQTKVTQLFANKPTEEKELLLALINIIICKKLIFTYNGQAFDIAYLNAKFDQHDIDFNIPLYKSFDLLRVIRKNKTKLNLVNYKLKTIEEFLGIFRADTISGMESIQLYNEYIETNSINIQEKILLHNFDDILNIIDLLEILDYCDIFSIYSEFKYPLVFDRNYTLSNTTDPIVTDFSQEQSTSLIQLYTKDIKILNQTIEITFYSPNFSIYDCSYLNKNMRLDYNLQTTILQLSLPILEFLQNDIYYNFFDIDSIFDNMHFNSLSIDDKLLLNFKRNELINYDIILSYLKKYFLDILYTVSK